jgi:hypothetical protein
VTPDQLSTKTGTPEYDVSEGREAVVGAEDADGLAQPPLKIIIVMPSDSRRNIRVCMAYFLLQRVKNGDQISSCVIG